MIIALVSTLEADGFIDPILNFETSKTYPFVDVPFSRSQIKINKNFFGYIIHCF